jgi:tRNA A37 threonylcarbamoyladenosine modification protein TsaB
VNNFLAVDTSSTSCSLILILDGQRYHRHLKGQAAHAEQFFAWIRELLELEPNLFKRLTSLGLCIGPGRFNGLRVGMTFISTLMALYQLPAYLCTSHQLLAEHSFTKDLDGYAIFAKYEHAYWCLKDNWLNTSLVTFDTLPSKISVMDMPSVIAVEHHDSLDIKDILSLINNNNAVLIEHYSQINLLYTANLC